MFSPYVYIITQEGEKVKFLGSQNEKNSSTREKTRDVCFSRGQIPQYRNPGAYTGRLAGANCGVSQC